MATRPPIDDLLDKLYSAPTNSEGWKDALTAIAQKFSSGWSGLIAADLGGDPSEPPSAPPHFQVYAGIPAEAQRLYDAHYAARDPWFIAAKERRVVHWIGRGTELCPVSEFERTEFYNDFFYAGRYPAFFQLGASVEIGNTNQAVLTILRTKQLGDYTAADVHDLHQLMPHLRRALEIDSRISALQRTVQGAISLLDRLDTAVFAMNQAGHCCYLNSKAESLLDCGVFLSLAAGQLRAVKSDESAALRQLIAGAVAKMWDRTPLGGHLTLHSGDNCLHVSVVPISAAVLRLPAEVCVLVTAFAPGDAPRSREEALTALFRLTAAETRIAMLLLQGLEPKEIAERARVSYDTVRFQLKAIFRKTGTSRQSQLVRLLSQLPGSSD